MSICLSIWLPLDSSLGRGLDACHFLSRPDLHHEAEVVQLIVPCSYDDVPEVRVAHLPPDDWVRDEVHDLAPRHPALLAVLFQNEDLLVVLDCIGSSDEA
eukprot:11125450-Heterocapsa_arctica.AAC.1